MIKSKHVLEKDIERKLVKGVKELGGLAMKWVSPGNAGVPDRVVFLPGGRVIFVELKTEDGKTSPVQERQIARLKALGCDVRVVRGVKEAEDFLLACNTYLALKSVTEGGEQE